MNNAMNWGIKQAATYAAGSRDVLKIAENVGKDLFDVRLSKAIPGLERSLVGL